MNPGLGNNFLVKTAKWPMVPLGTDSETEVDGEWWEFYRYTPNMNPGLGNNFLVKTAKWPMVPLGTDSQCDSNVIYILL